MDCDAGWLLAVTGYLRAGRQLDIALDRPRPRGRIGRASSEAMDAGDGRARGSAPSPVRRSRPPKGVTSTPKSGHEREIPLADPLYAPLQGREKGELGPLQAFQRAQERAGGSGFRFHDLRHFFVTQLFRGGSPAPAVQALAGHADLATPTSPRPSGTPTSTGPTCAKRSAGCASSGGHGNGVVTA